MYFLATVIVNAEDKPHKEQYLVDAVTFTEAEALCTKELRKLRDRRGHYPES